MPTNQEKKANEIIENYYSIITDGMIGALPFEIAKESDCAEFVNAKKCALVSVDLMIKYSPIENNEWLDLKSKIEVY